MRGTISEIINKYDVDSFPDEMRRHGTNKEDETTTEYELCKCIIKEHVEGPSQSRESWNYKK